ncbi:MAG: DUF5305 domain-containing protein [Oscillospiraceae bacterium]|nr:DUF5305 domain-containing protein [Oscillospiraceae bacterium]
MTSKTGWILCALLATFIVSSAAAIFVHMFLSYTPDTEIHLSGRNDVRFSVHYIENSIFDKAERPGNLQYLMSFTDYIEVEDSFLCRFSQNVNAIYRYSVTETLTIKPLKGSDDSNAQGVFEDKTILSEFSGRFKGERITWDKSGTDTPGGLYVINPHKHIDAYRYFVYEQREQMKKNDMTAEGDLRFTAEILIGFSYTVKAEEYGLDETFHYTLNIPISNEVFGIAAEGIRDIELSSTSHEFKIPGIQVAVLIVLLFLLNILGVVFCISRLITEKNKQRREVKRILKKYSDEIIESAHRIDLSEYKIIHVNQFKDLLKLAVNSSKHIIYYQGDKRAEFYAFSDGYVFCLNYYISSADEDEDDADGHDLYADDAFTQTHLGNAPVAAEE